MNAVDLSRRCSMAELVEMQRQITADPSNRLPSGGLHLYTRAARTRLHEIAWAITYKLKEKRGG